MALTPGTLRFIIVPLYLAWGRKRMPDNVLESKEYTNDLFGKYAFLSDQAALEQFIAGWKLGTLPKRFWTHAVHVGVAAYFAFEENHERTFAILRDGIRHYNTCVGTANTEESGYHETLTGFWAAEVGGLVRSGNFASRLDAVRAAVSAFGEDKYRFRLFYSFDVVASRRARREWIEPDLNPSRTLSEDERPLRAAKDSL